MDIGTGIAIAGAWLFPSACALSKPTNSDLISVSIFCAIGITIVVLWQVNKCQDVKK